MKNQLLLYSGGLDSTVLLASLASRRSDEDIYAVSIFYGQRHDKELECAAYQCDKYEAKPMALDLSTVFHFNPDSSTLLAASKKPIDRRAYRDEMSDQTLINTYVPFRNGLFLSVAASMALQLDCDRIYYAAHSEDAVSSVYPDCSKFFVEAMNKAIWEGTGHKVNVHAPFLEWNKAMVVKRGIHLDVDFAKTWSCYEGKESPCWQCGTCKDRLRAFEINGIQDPLMEVK